MQTADLVGEFSTSLSAINRPLGPGRKDQICPRCHHALVSSVEKKNLTSSANTTRIARFQMCFGESGDEDGGRQCEDKFPPCLDWKTCFTKCYRDLPHLHKDFCEARDQYLQEKENNKAKKNVKASPKSASQQLSALAYLEQQSGLAEVASVPQSPQRTSLTKTFKSLEKTSGMDDAPDGGASERLTLFRRIRAGIVAKEQAKEQAREQAKEQEAIKKRALNFDKDGLDDDCFIVPDKKRKEATPSSSLWTCVSAQSLLRNFAAKKPVDSSYKIRQYIARHKKELHFLETAEQLIAKHELDTISEWRLALGSSFHSLNEEVNVLAELGLTPDSVADFASVGDLFLLAPEMELDTLRSIYDASVAYVHRIQPIYTPPTTPMHPPYEPL